MLAISGYEVPIVAEESITKDRVGFRQRVVEFHCPPRGGLGFGVGISRVAPGKKFVAHQNIDGRDASVGQGIVGVLLNRLI